MENLENAAVQARRPRLCQAPTKRAKPAKRELPVDKSNELVVWWIDQP
jgi:hypothetical protein